MKATNVKYDFKKSLERIDEYLKAPVEYTEKSKIPNREELTFNNGFYVNCFSIFVDIRDSSKLTQKHQGRTLARLYRAYVSEVVSILNSVESCKEVSIVGDCVSAVYDSNEEKARTMISISARITSFIDILNIELKRKNNDHADIRVGIGVSQGRVLMIKGGNKGTGLNVILWMGNAVNEASNLCGVASKDGNYTITISRKVYEGLSNEINHEGRYYQDWFSFRDLYYTGSVINIEMNDYKNGL